MTIQELKQAIVDEVAAIDIAVLSVLCVMFQV